MAEAAHTTEHKDPSFRWLIFFFVCFALVMIGIVVFFARDINNESEVKVAPGGHGSMILPMDGQYAPHVQISRTT
jgi:hypothetical protein